MPVYVYHYNYCWHFFICELILIVICDGVNSAVIQWLDWSVVVAHQRRISTMFTLQFPELVKLKHTKMCQVRKLNTHHLV